MTKQQIIKLFGHIPDDGELVGYDISLDKMPIYCHHEKKRFIFRTPDIDCAYDFDDLKIYCKNVGRFKKNT